MANLLEKNVFDEKIYQLEKNDLVLGGENGPSNIQAKQLANRTNWLKSQVNQLVQQQIEVSYGSLQTQNRLSRIKDISSSWESNYALVYPPKGFSIANLIGFIPSISAIYYAGGVDGNDTIFCQYRKEVNCIRIIANNTENRSFSFINYLALWKK